MSGCHSPEGQMLINGSNLPKSSMEELMDKFENHIKRIEDFNLRNFNERIESLESQLKALTEMYKHLSMSIARCQDHQVRQIDENRKVSERIDGVINERQKTAQVP